jgi:hypothetical protein
MGKRNLSMSITIIEYGVQTARTVLEIFGVGCLRVFFFLIYRSTTHEKRRNWTRDYSMFSKSSGVSYPADLRDQSSVQYFSARRVL